MVAWLERMRKGRTTPVGLDLGRAAVKAVQLNDDGRVRVARVAATAAVDLWRAPGAAGRFFRDVVRPIADDAGFRGQGAVLALPAAVTHVTRVRIPLDLDDQAAGAEIVGEVERTMRDWLPFPLRQAIVRHVDAGLVYERHEPRREVVVMAVRRELLEQMLDAASAVFKVSAVVPEPTAVLAALAACEATDAGQMIVDLGLRAARAYVADGSTLRFARKVRTDALAEELGQCLRYVEATFPQDRVTRVHLIGGGADDASASELRAALDLPVSVETAAAQAGVARDADAETRRVVNECGRQLTVAMGLGMKRVAAPRGSLVSA